MNILVTTFTTQYLILLGVILLLIIALIIYLLTRKKKPVQSSISLEYLNDLYAALGGASNILNVKREHQRLQVKVDQMKLVDAQQLKTLEIPAFVKGKEITLLIKTHTQDVLSFLNDRRKEDS
ncbi:MAG: hypothetical protein KKH01_04255 [Firmicutes bacterium]|nr:hypothetical protein [Bacillota bacterium]